MIQIASFDIGKKNFAQYVERFPAKLMFKLEKKYKSLPKAKQRRVKGVMNPDIQKILTKVMHSGECLDVGVYDLTEGEYEGYLGVRTRQNLIAHLEERTEIWDKCDIFIIEQQYFNPYRGRTRKGQSPGGANMDAIKLAEVAFTWFLVHYPFAEITYFSSSFKTQILGAPGGMNKTQRKNWATAKFGELSRTKKDIYVYELYELAALVKRKRMSSEEKIQGFVDTYISAIKKAGLPLRDDVMHMAQKIVRYRQKLDDVADSCLQCQAFKFRRMVGCF